MSRRGAIVHVALALAGGVAAGAGMGGARGRADEPPNVPALVERLIANQHRNDAALAEYERRERQVIRKNDKDEKGEPSLESKTYRVVPTGTGTLRLMVEENGQPVKPEFYGKQLRDLERALEDALRPNEPRQRQAIEKWEKRTRARRHSVEAVRDAFLFTWQGRETRHGRALVKLGLAPNPEYKGRSRQTQIFAQVRATLWVDEATGQLQALSAELLRDIGFGGGVLGKVYKGSRFVMEQREVAEGVWLASRFEYDLRGRKFLFGFETRESIEVTGYRRIGPPQEALAEVRRELSNTPTAHSAR